MLSFTIPGPPVPWSRTGRNRHTPPAMRRAKKVVAQYAMLAMKERLEGPIEVMVTAYFKPAKSWSRAKANLAMGKPHTQKPDADNLLKLVLDACNGVVYADDAQVARMSIAKRWAAEARTEVFIREHPL